MQSLESQEAHARLVRVLQHAYSGELAAAKAYAGHAQSLPACEEREHVDRIRNEELEHRSCVGRMLDEIGGRPNPRREFFMGLIGLIIGLLCRIGGWLVPMYGAGRLESANVGEYEAAARHAWKAGLGHLSEGLLQMAEVEWDHEAYFRGKCETHVWMRVMPKWRSPGEREAIRASFAKFMAENPRH